MKKNLAVIALAGLICAPVSATTLNVYNWSEYLPQSLIERFLGIKVAYAHTEHNIPSAWWELELEGEITDPKPLNTEEIILINGRFHPTDNYLALSTNTGLRIIDLEESANLPLEELLPGNGFGMLDWVTPNVE